MEQSPIQKAVTAAGSQTALARALGCTPQNVQHMCATGSVPAKHVLKIEASTGVSRTELRPDLYPESSADHAQKIPLDSRLEQSAAHAVQASSTQGPA
ncbi:helix-turn-helix domain-containing protein [Pseudomonas nitroreducens]|uniref:Helix-turn-helix domain-containing protein n=1 Tax=Pseudomonas nitroreducens TaxID=46680 RepID=A0ABS0KVL5_PSENT|nr:YdaS family helix-turn-helix protein [Pseudomonas nitroreducens]MBG6292084.1 helix-turn-helix domain-containing protein [Pseudomonas nitroreducens]